MPSVETSIDQVIAEFGRATARKFASPVARGEPEDQLRGPLEALFTGLAAVCRMDPAKLTLIGESSLAELRTRPDFAVTYDGVLVGYVEVKAPGKGADPRKFRDPHDKEQWQKLQALPNLVYTDGNTFSLWRSGESAGRMVTLVGDVETAGSALRPGPGLVALFEDFLSWQPLPPANAKQLAETSARLCRLLRDEVTEQLAASDQTLAALAEEWRQLLFPNESDEQFADGYAQAVTFGLLLARARGIDLSDGIEPAARQLGRTHSLIGRALSILTDEAVATRTLVTSVQALTRVLSVVDWARLRKGDAEVWLYFYETFLAEYDPVLRRKTGSYYTPPEVVESMTSLVDEALRERFDLRAGLADDSVTVVDPAVGTGTFLLAVLRSIARFVAEDLGPDTVPSALAHAIKRLIGFELQLGPFAVAQLRILAELAELGLTSPAPGDLRMYVTNTLDNPYVEEGHLGVWYEPIAASRRQANEVKRNEPVFVVLGNPPYKEKSHGQGAWIEQGSLERADLAPLRDFLPAPEWGVGAHVKHLYNPYVYFWRWALGKVFDWTPQDDRGVICFITVAGFLDGPGFQGMRRYLRKRSDEIWVIDCSPEGHQPPVNTRVFQGVQQPVCIVLAIRDGSTSDDQPAQVWFRSLAKGDRAAKFTELAELRLSDDGWRACPEDWRAPFAPEGNERWTSFPALDDLLRWSGSGTMPGRTWIIAPDRDCLTQRWDALVNARPEDKPALLQEHQQDRRLDTRLSDNLPGYPPPAEPIGEETGPCPKPIRIGYRSFDRQWIIPDKRLINRPNPTLWSVRSDQQVYLTAPHDTAPSNGPALTFTGLVPDLHHYKGSFGGRAYPLWLDDQAAQANIVPGLLEFLSLRYGREVGPRDLFGYLATVAAHPAYPESFAADLTTPGLRIPLTGRADLFFRAAELGSRVIWLHTYGERFADPESERPRSTPRLPSSAAPRVARGYPIPTDEDGMPDSLTYHADERHLMVGRGVIENVTPEMFGYQVSGVNVVGKWFSYRRRNRQRPIIGDRRQSALSDIQSPTWRHEYTVELIDLLHVLGLLTELEAGQRALLDEIVAGPLISVADLTSVGVLPVPAAARKASTVILPELSEATLF